VKFGQSRRGNLTLSVPRAARSWLLLAPLTLSLAFATAWIVVKYPEWSRPGAVLLGGWIVALVVWKLLPDGTLEFDARNGMVLRDGRRIARIADIECVQISVQGIGEDAAYLVELRAGGEAPLLLGFTRDESEASIAAARIAGAVDRPVKAGD
jgi:hypothetical protein